MKIVIATFNEGKFREFKDLFSNSSFEILSLKVFTTQDIDETGRSYEENAMIKAQKASELSNYPSLGDDSGLEVKLLNNDPGLFSARYSGKNATDETNIKKLLKETKNLENTKAKFVSTLAFYDPQKDLELFSFGELEGEIIKEKKGDKGFGYDPIFKIKNSSQTLAEVSFKERMKISHRAKSSQEMLKHLNRLYK
ncbi:MAG: RdgB/HAM1 family non-canonical purine NTP pyrophosphatase [SAR86 cluster bacterium]|uniref:dITP/XTP pyrophosphatase n=1 Tax=SAR86 cluster bacterium TaxID=2030880 RepID=A0A937LGA7_9GAMM|nr:RdgB/HAM1 family non-canonical purine NTP pyrophosphatase [SAR86 cluster bacterium]